MWRHTALVARQVPRDMTAYLDTTGHHLHAATARSVENLFYFPISRNNPSGIFGPAHPFPFFAYREARGGDYDGNTPAHCPGVGRHSRHPSLGYSERMGSENEIAPQGFFFFAIS
jgi:hypothetical protein